MWVFPVSRLGTLRGLRVELGLLYLRGIALAQFKGLGLVLNVLFGGGEADPPKKIVSTPLVIGIYRLMNNKPCVYIPVGICVYETRNK